MTIDEYGLSQQLAQQGLPDLGRTFRGSQSGADVMATRVKMVSAEAPFLSAGQAASLAQQQIPIGDLRDQVRATAGVFKARQMASLLGTQDDKAQRRTFAALDEPVRQQLLAQGYKLPQDQGLVGNILHDAGQTLSHPLSMVTQPLKSGLGVLNRLNDIVPHQYRAMADYTGHGAINDLRHEAVQFASEIAPPLALLDRDYRRSWTNTYEGEDYILEDNKRRAREMAANDQVYELALATARAEDPFKAIEKITGQPFGSPGYQAAYSKYAELIQDDTFKSTVRELAVGKVSVGRDLARGVGLTETDDRTSAYGIVSGAGDAVVAWFADPTLIGGKVRKGMRIAERGVAVAADHPTNAARILSFAADEADKAGLNAATQAADTAAAKTYTERILNKLDAKASATAAARHAALRSGDEAAYWAALDATGLNDFERYATAVTDHFATGNPYGLMRLDKKIAPIYHSMEEYAASNADDVARRAVEEGRTVPEGLAGFDRPSDWFRFMASEDGIAQLAGGHLGGYLHGTPEMPTLSRIGQRRMSTIVRMRDEISWLANDSKLALSPSEGDLLTLPSRRMDMTAGLADVLRPFAKTADKLMNALPTEPILQLEAQNLPTELRKVLAMGYSTLDQEFWFNKFYETTNPAARRRVVQSALRTMYGDLGIAATPAGREWIEKEIQKTYQAYSVAGRDIGADGVRMGLDPDIHQANAIPIPGFDEIRKMSAQSKRLSLNWMLFGSVPASYADGFMGVWKPSVVLRLGFIPRAAGEEALAWMFREGLRPLLEHWTVLPMARRSDEELLAPFRMNARFLSWMSDASVLERGQSAEIASNLIERMYVTNQMLGQAATPFVRNLARAPYETKVGQLLRFDPARLEMSTQVYQARRLQALARAESALTGAEAHVGVDFVDIPGVGRARVDQDAQAMLVKARQRQVARLQYARQYHMNPVVQRVLGEEWMRVSAVGGSNIYDRAVNPLEDATLVTTGKNRLGRPARQRYGMKAVGGQFTNVSTDDLKAYFNAVKPMESSRAYQKAAEVSALYLDPELVAETARIHGTDYAHKAMSDAWDALDERSVVRYATREYLASGDTEALGRALSGQALHELPSDQADWLRELLTDPNKYGRRIIESVVADTPKLSKGLDAGTVAALRAGDLDLLDVTGKRELVRRLSQPDMAEALKKMDRMHSLPDGRTVTQPVAAGMHRVYTPMVDFDTARRLLKGQIDITDPVAAGAYRRIISRMDEEQLSGAVDNITRTGRPQLVPLSGWATSDQETAEAVAAALNGMSPTATIGRTDIPVARAHFHPPEFHSGETELTDADIMQLTPIEQTATHDEAIRDMADKLWAEHKDLTFSKRTGKPMPDIVRPLSDGEFDMGHLLNADHADLPLEVLAPERVPYHIGFMSQLLTKGFEEIISPAIDAIAREPMFVEHSMQRMRGTRWVRSFYETPQTRKIAEQVTTAAARHTGINLSDDLLERAKSIQFNIEYAPIEGTALGFASGDTFYLDQAKIRANYEAGLAKERSAAERLSKGDPPRSAAGAFAWAGVDPDHLYQWFERHGGYKAYEQFIYDHERAHIVLGHTHIEALEPSAYPTEVAVGKPGEIEPMVREKAQAAIVEVKTDPIQLKKARTDAARRQQGVLSGTAPKEGAAVTYPGRKLPGNLSTSVANDDPAMAAVNQLGLDTSNAQTVAIVRSRSARGDALAQETIADIRDAARAGKSFVIGDGDPQLAKVLDGLGADYEIVHTGQKANVKIARPSATSPGPRPPAPTQKAGTALNPGKQGPQSAVGQGQRLADQPYFHLPENATEAQREAARRSLEQKIRSRAKQVGLDPDTILRDQVEIPNWADKAALTGRDGHEMMGIRSANGVPNRADLTDPAVLREFGPQLRSGLDEPIANYDQKMANREITNPNEDSYYEQLVQLRDYLDEVMPQLGIEAKASQLHPDFLEWINSDAGDDARAMLRRSGFSPEDIATRPDEVKAAVQKARDQIDRQERIGGMSEQTSQKQMDLDSILMQIEEVRAPVEGAQAGATIASPSGDPLRDAANQIDEAMAARGYTDEEMAGISEAGRKEIEANDFAFRLGNMPFGDYVSKGDEAVLQLRMAWDSMPEYLRREDIPIAQLRKSDEVPDLIKKLSGDELRRTRMHFSHEDKIEGHIAQIAFGGAAEDMVPYIDASNIRSQFQSYVRHFIPFQFAEEQFLKRWARTFTHSPEAIRKAQLYWHGLQQAGIIEHDEYGQPIFVFPGTGAMKMAFARVQSLFGGNMVIPEASNLTGNVRYALPGMDSMGVPSASPLVGLPMKYLGNQFPELRQPIDKFQNVSTGGRGVNRSYVDQLVPTSIMRLHHALLANPDRDKSMMVAQNATIRWMAAEDPAYFAEHGEHLFPGEDATAQELEVFKDRVKRWTRSNFVLQAVLGFVTPTTPTFDVPDLAPEFKKYLQASGDYEQALGAFLKDHPDATPYTIFNNKSVSGYSFDTTKSTAPFILNHKELLDGYKYAGAYLVPDAPPGDEFDRQAYNESIALEMRQLGAPDQVVREIYYRAGAKGFYEESDKYEQAIVTLGNNTKAKQRASAKFSAWKKDYLAQHPVFAEELASGQAHERRTRIVNEMRDLLEEPAAKDSPNAAPLRELMRQYDLYQEAYDVLKQDQTTRGKARAKAAKNKFDNWSRSFVADNQAVEHFYLRVIRPDIRGLPDVEQAAA